MRCRLAAFSLIPPLTWPTALEARARTPQAVSQPTTAAKPRPQPAAPVAAPQPVPARALSSRRRADPAAAREADAAVSAVAVDVLRNDPLLTNDHYWRPIRCWRILAEHPGRPQPGVLHRHQPGTQLERGQPADPGHPGVAGHGPGNPDHHRGRIITAPSSDHPHAARLPAWLRVTVSRPRCTEAARRFASNEDLLYIQTRRGGSS